MFDWNDLKYLLAVARHQSTTAAGKALRVNQSTVQRRIAELERSIGQPLVRRHPTGYRLTESGLQLLPQAQRIEQVALEIAAGIETCRREATGVVRVTCPEPLVYRITASTLLERFRARHPGLEVEFVMSDRYVDFASGGVDIALRSGDTEDNALVGRRIGDSLWAVYASPRYVARRGQPDTPDDLARHDWVGLDASMSGHRAAQWLRATVPEARVVARNDSILGLVYSAKAGIGLAPLPTALGDSEPDLIRVFGPVPELARIWRVLTTPELRRVPRVAALFEFLVDEIDALRPIITG